MMEIPDRPFNKIAIDIITECETSTSGNKHILTIICHLTYWITEQNSRIVSWTKSYNNLELTGYSQHHTIHRVVGKLEVFHKYLKPTLKKLCEKDPANWD